MAILIRDAEADRIVRELATRTGQTITDAVKSAALRRLEELAPLKRGRIDMERLDRILARIQDLPTVDDRRSDDDIIGYGENGLPS